MRHRLAPVATVDAAALRGGERALVRDAAWASLTGSLSGGVVLVAFALALGAGPFVIGLLAAIPLVAQVAQLAGIALIERLRERKRIAIPVITVSRVLILGIAALPFVPDPDVAIGLLIAAQLGLALAGSFGACAVNSWLHQLIPQERLGPFFAQRLLWGTLIGALGAIVAGQLIDRVGQGGHAKAIYAAVFVAAALAGFVSSWYLARVPEPRMLPPGEPVHVLRRLEAPLRDANFRSMLLFLGAWTVASNIAAPFLTVYLLRQLGLGIATVTVLGTLGQLANAAALYLWGRLSTRMSNKSVLSAALPVFFVCTFALALVDQPARPWLVLTLLAVVHVLMGAASGGIGLAASNLGLKLAPQGQATAYLAMVGLITALAGGLAPLAAGSAAAWFEARELSVWVRWQVPDQVSELSVVSFSHWEFLFVLSALAGLYVLHRLSRIQEDGTVKERVVIQMFAIEAARTVDSLSSLGALGLLFPFRRFGWWGADRRRVPRKEGERGRPR